MVYFSMFDTVIGTCAVGWSPLGICSLQLPESDEEHTQERLLARHPDAVEVRYDTRGTIGEAVQMVQLHLRGQLQDLQQISLDLSECSYFAAKVYMATRLIPAGTTNTYGQLARAIDSPLAARAVGGALGANPVALIVPCHRVLGKGSRLTGFSAFGGCGLKMRLLSIEGALSSGLLDHLA